MTRPKILDTLASITPDDLAAIDAELATLDEQVSKLRRTRKFLAAVLGVEADGRVKRSAARTTAAPSPKDAVVPTGELQAAAGKAVPLRRKEIAALLAKEGTMFPPGIAAAIRVPPESVEMLLRCDWFQRIGNGAYHLTTTGRREGLAA